MREIYPVTIVLDRYGGAYNGGYKWTAWNLDFEEVPEEINSNDVKAMNYWYEPTHYAGLGQTPQEALNSLMEQIK